MARLNINQLRQWMNGDVINAQEYNQERNLIIEAQNDTNTKANEATLNADNALQRANRLELQATNIQETSIIQSSTFTLTDGQTILTLPEPGYLPNTNRIQVYNQSGQRIPFTETSNTQITLQTPATQNQQVTVEIFTELPRIFDIERIEQAITNAKVRWLEPVGVVGQLPYPAEEGDHIAVTSEEKVYRFQDDQWVYVMDAPKILEEGVPKVVQLTKVHTASENQATFDMPLNFDTQTDSAIIFHNTVLLAPGTYSITNTQLTIQTPAKAGDQIVILAHKAVLMGTEGSVTGLSITPGTMPVNRIQGGEELVANVTSNTQAVTDLTTRVRRNEDDLSNMKVIKSGKDANGTFTTVTYRRKSDDSVCATSVLSGGTSPNYTTRTVTRYQTDGITVRSTTVYTLTYDADGLLVSEV